MKTADTKLHLSRPIRHFWSVFLLFACLAAVPFVSASPWEGKYVAATVSNDWHYAQITAEGNAFRWTNKAGVSWTLTQEEVEEGGEEFRVLIIGKDAPEGYKGVKLKIVYDPNGSYVVKLEDSNGGVWNKKDW